MHSGERSSTRSRSFTQLVRAQNLTTTRHLQQGVGVLQEPSGDGVPRLVICHRLLLLWLQNLSLLLQTSNTQEAA